MKYIPLLLTIAGLSTFSAAALGELKGDAQRGKKAAAVCVSCHQADGNGKHVEDGESWPRLAGLNAEYIAKQLRDFKSGSRSNATMKPFASMLDQQQVVDVAAYYSQLKPAPGQGGEKADEARLQRGEMIAQRGDWSNYIVSCTSCHGPGNQGSGAVFPGIAGQHAGYIEAQLQAWKSKTRNNDPQDLMGTVARRMSNDDILAVAAWLANQSPANQSSGAGQKDAGQKDAKQKELSQ